MNTPTKRIFYLFEAKIAKNEPQTKVWGSLTCKSQCSRPFTDGHGRSRLFAAAFAPVAAGRSRFRARSRRSQPVAAGSVPVRAGRSRFRARSRWSHPFAAVARVFAAAFTPVVAGSAHVRAGRATRRGTWRTRRPYLLRWSGQRRRRTLPRP